VKYNAQWLREVIGGVEWFTEVIVVVIVGLGVVDDDCGGVEVI